jgi:hypothetical protein
VIRVAAVDEWAWRKGTKFGTIVVDLERRRVVDLLADRVAARMADWFKQHPQVEIINRDRDGLYADAARQGAPQARQVADRFHLLKNLRETIARQLGGFEAPIRESATEVEDGQDTPEQPPIDRSDRCSETAERERLRRRRRAARQAMFDEIRALFDAGSTVGEIPQKRGLGRRRVYRWVRRIDMPERNAMPPNPLRRPISVPSWHEAGPKGRPRSATCSLTYAIVVTRVHTAIWRASSLPGAAAVHRTMAYLPTRRRQLRPRCV